MIYSRMQGHREKEREKRKKEREREGGREGGNEETRRGEEKREVGEKK